MVVFGQKRFYSEKVVVLGLKWLYSVKIECIRENWKVVVFGEKLLC